MKKNRLKKNKISKISFDKKRKHILSKKDYIYLFKNKLSEKKFDLKKIKSLAILVLQCGKKSYLNIENKKINLKKNKVIIIENKK